MKKKLKRGGKKVYSSSYSLSLAPGERKILEFSFEPEDASLSHNYNVNIACDGDYHSGNNEEEASVGFCDIEISDCGFREGGIEGEQIYARIRNSGNLPVGSSVIRIYKGMEKEELVCEATLGTIMPGEEAPVALDLIQEAGEVYHITVEAANDSVSDNNSGMICDDRIKETENKRNSSIIYNKDRGTVKALISRDELEISEGKLIWAIYSPAGYLDKLIKEDFSADENAETVEKEISAPDEGRVRLMIWKNISSMQPGFDPLDLLITGK